MNDQGHTRENEAHVDLRQFVQMGYAHRIQTKNECMAWHAARWIYRRVQTRHLARVGCRFSRLVPLARREPRSYYQASGVPSQVALPRTHQNLQFPSVPAVGMRFIWSNDYGFVDISTTPHPLSAGMQHLLHMQQVDSSQGPAQTTLSRLGPSQS